MNGIKARAHRLSRVGLLVATVALPSTILGQTSDTQVPPVSLPCSRSHKLQSNINGRTYPIDIALPMQYCADGITDTTHYPVLFLLDNFVRSAAPYFRFRSNGGQIEEPGLILVGIGSPPDPPGPPTGQGGYWRHIDYYTPETAVRDSSARSASGPDEIEHTSARAATRWMADTVMKGKPGEAPIFLRVLREEIIPFVDRTYRTTQDRGLFGFSAGGYFATYVLFTAPDLFERYAIASPVYWWDDYSIFRLEGAFARSRSSLAKQIVMTAGSLERQAIVDNYRMSAALWDGMCVTEGMRLTTEIVPGGHYTLQGLWRSIDILYPIVR